MNQYSTQAIVLRRIEYEEADRVLTFLTPSHGKISAIARGVRKVKSKLAGGIELLTVNDIVIIEGRGEVKTLRSSRMLEHFPLITTEYERTQLGYEALKLINQATESHTETLYFDVLRATLRSLGDAAVPVEVTEFWLRLQLLNAAGHLPELHQDIEGNKLNESTMYHFVQEEGALQESNRGTLGSDHIKFARLSLQMLPQKLIMIKSHRQLAKDWLEYLH